MVTHEGRIQRAHQQHRAVVVGTDDDAVGAHEVVDRGTFLQKLRVAADGKGHLDAACRQCRGDRRAHFVGGADGHRALVHDHLVVRHVAADGFCGGEHVLQVGRAILVGWRADADKLQGAMCHCGGHIGRELQPCGGDIALHHRVEPRLVDRNLAAPEHFDLARVDIEADDMVAHFCQACARDQAHIACANDSNFHCM